MTIHLTVPGVLAAMTAAVEARGRDFVYQPPAEGRWATYCVYVRDGCADCLAGEALYRCGVPLETLSAYEGEAVKAVVDTLVADGDVTADPHVRRVLDVAQEVQDGRVGEPGSWGEALDAATQAARVVAS